MSEIAPGLEGPRDHHYAFAHRVLPQWLFEDPVHLLEALSTDEGTDILRSLWLRVGEHFDMSERVAAQGLGHEIRTVGAALIVVLFVLPPPRVMTEAYFVAGVLRVPEESSLHGTFDVRVLTLELTDPRQYASEEYLLVLEKSGQDQPGAVLCEWTREGTHLNFGRYVEPTLEAFFSAVVEEVSRTAPPR